MDDPRTGHEYRGHRVTYETADRQRGVDYFGVVVQYAAAIILVALIVMLCKKGYDIGYAVLANRAVDDAGEGQTVNQIGTMLEENGLILDADIFPMQELLSSYHNKIAPGTYELTSEMTPTSICEALAYKPSESSSTDSTGESGTREEAPVCATTDVWAAITAMFTDPDLGQFQK